MQPIKHPLKVDIQKKGPTPWPLDVDETGKANHIGKHDTEQLIVWSLKGFAGNGQFMPMTDAKAPAFRWDPDNQPGPGIFGKPVVCPSCGDLSMTVLNRDEAGSGEWVYQLSVKVGNDIHQTQFKPLLAPPPEPCDSTDDSYDPCQVMRITTNPRIKNT